MPQVLWTWCFFL